MGWLDDARKKAEETADEAKSKAQEKAAEAAVAAAGAAVKKSVGGFFEGLISSAEASLAEAEENARTRGQKLDGPAVDASEELEQQIRDPAPDPLGEAVRRAEAVAWEDPVSAPVVAPTPSVPDLPEPAPRPTDPFADAYAAIAMAREARGAEPEDEVAASRPADPVEAALAAAREARAYATSGGSRALEREAAARAQLEAMKAGRTTAAGPSPSNDSDDSENPLPSAPKKRTL